MDGGALIFNQSTLSRKRKNQEQLEEQAKLNPSALSYKRPGIVTRPDVEHALVLWVKHMEEKRETINGPMLREKRKRFEEEFNVPADECLGDGWVPSLCKTYRLKEYRRHGEASSTDPEAVEAERKRIQGVLALFAERTAGILTRLGCLRCGCSEH